MLAIYLDKIKRMLTTTTTMMIMIMMTKMNGDVDAFGSARCGGGGAAVSMMLSIF